MTPRRVFLSSVGRELHQERDQLADMVKAAGHEPVRYEDFASSDMTPRGRCLYGVDSSEVYVLILGPLYGDPLEDTGVAPTEEEWNRAHTRGIPILVFRKQGVDFEQRQQDFIDKVGEYTGGKFYKTFNDAHELCAGVIEALRGLEIALPPLRWEGVTEPAVRWRTDRPQPRETSYGAAPVLEVHLIPVGTTERLPSTAIASAGDRLAATARDTGFMSQSDHLSIDHDADEAWVIRTGPQEPRQWDKIQNHPLAGLHVSRDGSVVAYQALPTDLLGAFVDQADLTQRLVTLLRQAVYHVPAVEKIAIAAGIDPADHVQLGDPAQVGNRSSGSMGWNNEPVRVPATDAVSLASLQASIPEAANEIALKLVEQLRSRSR